HVLSPFHSFSFDCPRHPPSPPSLPTRRSSDLRDAERTRADLVARARRRSPWRAAVADFLFDRARKLGGLREFPKFVWLSAIAETDRKSTRLNSSHVSISYAVFCLKKKKDERNI